MSDMQTPPSFWASYANAASLQRDTVRLSPPGNPHAYLLEKGSRSIKLERIPQEIRDDREKLGQYINDPKRQDAAEAARGFKFHLSVHPEDVELAWDMIVDCIQEQGVYAAKALIGKTIKEWNASHQKGKMITLYAYEAAGQSLDSAPLDWPSIINNIEALLAIAGVRPGPEITSDKLVPGAAYSYYRSDMVTERIDELFDHIGRKISFADKEDRHQYVDVDAEEKYYADRGTTREEEEDADFQRFGFSSGSSADSHPVFWKKEFFLKEARKKLPDFSDEELELLIPQSDRTYGREVISRLPAEKRYKMSDEVDPFDDIRIENAHSLAAMREKAIKDRGINQVS